ncbi:hypothetical protein NUW58_g3855 [Xylaria curta]|uniref:Uncharacterized protein n=1 Tax=Xylaria curta TaxID=42375 RepID=A0ACC1P9Z4_9PEZI|nr:hypothetical protein NUW58_g3855 [Xylaria curta]
MAPSTNTSFASYVENQFTSYEKDRQMSSKQATYTTSNGAPQAHPYESQSISGPVTGGLEGSFNGTGKTHHFAVRSRDERIDWMRELMLAKALKQKGEGFESHSLPRRIDHEANGETHLHAENVVLKPLMLIGEGFVVVSKYPNSNLVALRQCNLDVNEQGACCYESDHYFTSDIFTWRGLIAMRMYQNSPILPWERGSLDYLTIGITPPPSFFFKLSQKPVSSTWEGRVFDLLPINRLPPPLDIVALSPNTVIREPDVLPGIQTQEWDDVDAAGSLGGEVTTVVAGAGLSTVKEGTDGASIGGHGVPVDTLAPPVGCRIR